MNQTVLGVIGGAAALGAALALAGCGKPPAPAAQTTIQQYMENEVNPAGEYLFHSVRMIADDKGTRLDGPSTDAQWQEVRERLELLRDAPKILTAGDVKAAPPGFKSEHPPIESEPAVIQRLIDDNRGDFNLRAHRLQASSEAALKAVDAKDPKALMQSLDAVDKACESCHLRYFYPNDLRAKQAAKEDNLTY